MTDRAGSRFLVVLFLTGLMLALPDDASSQLSRGKRFDKGESCVGCHEGVAEDVKYRHEPLRKRECAACHKPHGLVGVLRLQKPEPDLCLDCHAPETLQTAAEHTHPDAGGSSYSAGLHRA